MDLFEKITEERDDALEKLAKTRAENEDLQQTRDAKRLHNTQHRETLAQLETVLDEAQQRFNAKNEEQAAIRIASGKRKKENADLREAL